MLRLLTLAFVAIMLLTLASAVPTPVGTFRSDCRPSGTIEIDQSRGCLARIGWNELETAPGVFDWVALDAQFLDDDEGDISLVVNGGIATPTFIHETLGAEPMTIAFRGEDVTFPKYWDSILQERIRLLAVALGERYGDDPRLKLVYVTQMSSNGVEGHFNGVSEETLTSYGYTTERWVASCLNATQSFLTAFPKQSVALELHEINFSTAHGSAIMDAFSDDAAYEKRAGIGMWYLSGSETYNADMIALLRTFPGKVYGQVIGRSDQLERFPVDGYKGVFDQAMSIGICYIEPWTFEFKQNNETLRTILTDYNDWATANCDTTVGEAESSTPSPSSSISPSPSPSSSPTPTPTPSSPVSSSPTPQTSPAPSPASTTPTPTPTPAPIPTPTPTPTTISTVSTADSTVSLSLTVSPSVICMVTAISIALVL